MAEQGVSEKAVEAAARVAFRSDRDSQGRPRNADVPLTDGEIRVMRKVVAAALPHLEAEWTERLLSDEACLRCGGEEEIRPQSYRERAKVGPTVPCPACSGAVPEKLVMAIVEECASGELTGTDAE